jgi:hypothetical protein
VAYIQFGAFQSKDAVENQLRQLEGQLNRYRQAYPDSAFGKIRLFTHRGQDGLYRVFGDHFNAASDAQRVCQMFKTDSGQPCFPVGKESMNY